MLCWHTLAMLLFQRRSHAAPRLPLFPVPPPHLMQVLYQNASSLAYMGDLLSVKYDNRLSEGLLRVLFMYDLLYLEQMLKDVLNTQEWQGVVQVCVGTWQASSRNTNIINASISACTGWVCLACQVSGTDAWHVCIIGRRCCTQERQNTACRTGGGRQAAGVRHGDAVTWRGCTVTEGRAEEAGLGAHATTYFSGIHAQLTGPSASQHMPAAGAWAGPQSHTHAFGPSEQPMSSSTQQQAAIRPSLPGSPGRACGARPRASAPTCQPCTQLGHSPLSSSLP